MTKFHDKGDKFVKERKKESKKEREEEREEGKK